MQERFQYNPGEIKKMTTEDLREAFAITDLMEPGQLNFTYTHYDR